MMNDMSDEEFFKALRNIKYKLPEWMEGTTVQEQIEYQRQEVLKNNPDWPHFMAFTFNPTRTPKVQKHVVETNHEYTNQIRTYQCR